jgi:hypothetical protein
LTQPKLRGRPEKIFISVDESKELSTLSFQPPDSGDPHQYTDDKSGKLAVAAAKSIVEKYPGCVISGPHFHTARPANARVRPRKRAPM